MASISDLPLELLLFIARFSDYEYDLCALSQTNRRLYFLLSPEVYRRLRETPNPALEWSAINGKKDCVRRLLEAGVPPDMNPTVSLKPIVLASYYGHTDVVKSFIQNGVDPSQMTFVGQRYLEPPSDKADSPPLINTLGAACIKGHEQVVRLLLKHGVEAQPSSKPDDTNQPLCLATRDGNQSIMKILLDHGADPTIRGLNGFNALEYAASLDLEYTLLLLEQISVDNLFQDDDLPKEPARLALRAGNIPVLKFWLDLTLKNLQKLSRGFLYHLRLDLDIEWDQPATKLLLSYIDVESLLQEVLNLPSSNFELFSIAHVLPALARKMLEKDLMNPDEMDYMFKDAAKYGRIHIMNVLTAHGVNGEKYHREPIGLFRLDYWNPSEPEATRLAKRLVEDDTGPYMIHSDHALRVLLSLGDLTILRNYLDTWDVSEEAKLKEISNSICLAIHRESDTLFDFCLELGVKLDPRTSSHWRAFKNSVRRGAITVTKQFLDAGFDVNRDYQSARGLVSPIWHSRPHHDYTTLYHAFSTDDIELSIKTAAFLLEHGADLEQKLPPWDFYFDENVGAMAEERKRTCLLHLIQKSKKEARNAMICRGVKFLLEHGADPFTTTTASETALTLAVKDDFLSVTKVILEFFDAAGMPFDKIKNMIWDSVTCGFNMPVGNKYNETTRLLYRYYWRRVHAVPT